MAERAADPQTSAINPLDEDFQGWLDGQREVERSSLRNFLELQADEKTGARQPASRQAARIGDTGEPIPRPGPGTGGGTTAATPLRSFFAYVNSRPDKDWNTCGQAAIASMLDFYKRDLGLTRQSDGHWDDGEAIDKVIASGFGPDVVFGWGTTPGRLDAALTHFGVAAEARSSGLFFSGWTTEWNRLLAYVYYSAIPVPVLVDMGVLGNAPFGAHWPILWKMQYSASGLTMHLANWSSGWHSLPVPSEKFLEAWACRHLPLGFNHAAIYTGSPRVSF